MVDNATDETTGPSPFRDVDDSEAAEADDTSEQPTVSENGPRYHIDQPQKTETTTASTPRPEPTADPMPQTAVESTTPTLDEYPKAKVWAAVTLTSILVGAAVANLVLIHLHGPHHAELIQWAISVVLILPAIALLYGVQRSAALFSASVTAVDEARVSGGHTDAQRERTEE